MGYTLDGIPIQSFFSEGPQGDAVEAQTSEYRIQVGQVLETLPIDSPDNLSKKYCEYNVLVAENTDTPTVYRNVRPVDGFGGNSDFNEIGYQETTVNKDDPNLIPDDKNGAFVLLACMYGDKDYAIILDAIQHPAIRGKDNVTPVPAFTGGGDSDSRDDEMNNLPTLLPGASLKEGKRMLGEYNGLRWNINKDGELTIMFQGIKDVDGKLTNKSAQPTILKFNKDGEFLVIDNLDQEIKISPKDKKILISSGNGDKIEIDRAAGTINLESTKDTEQTAGGKWTINVKGKAAITAQQVTIKGTTGITLDSGSFAPGQVLTTTSSPIVDAIFGAPSIGVPLVKAS